MLPPKILKHMEKACAKSQDWTTGFRKDRFRFPHRLAPADSTEQIESQGTEGPERQRIHSQLPEGYAPGRASRRPDQSEPL
jgi:hypothetical protein